MLGISSGLMYSDHVEWTCGLIRRYESDFTENDQGWIKTAVTEGTIEFTANETAPGSSATGEWLKCTYDTTQTSSSGGGILLSSGFWPSDEPSIVADDYFTISYDIYFLNDGGKWQGSDPVSSRVQHFGLTSTTAVNLDTITSVGPSTITSTGNQTTYLAIDVQVGSDLPQEGAVFYIKDIVAELHRPCP
jgi:hypothetical protein